MGATKIPWCDVTINPFPGCRNVSEGCENCYAEVMAKRLKAMGQTQYSTVIGANGKWTGQVGLNPAAIDVPGTGKRVFVQSMGDLFYEEVTDEQRDWAFNRMIAQEQHTWLILTKRVDQALNYYKTREWWHAGQCTTDPLRDAGNIWLGVTAENQKWADRRIPVLLLIPAAGHFVSLEPLLGPIDLMEVRDPNRFPYCLRLDVLNGKEIHEDDDYASTSGGHLDWVIVGCESGPRRRPCKTEWVADIVCQGRDGGVPMFVKQIEIDGKVVHDPERIALELSDYIGRPICVEDIRQFPKMQPQRTQNNGNFWSLC